MGSPIFHLPNELMFAVIEQLSIVDAFQLGLTCRHFAGVGYSNSLCRVLLEKQAPFSQEALEITNPHEYAKAFRKLAKRKLAMTNLEPFSATIIAVADSHLYVNSTLLYINERELRVLQLRGKASYECVVSIRALLDEAVEESRSATRYKFTLLHYADGIAACRYSHRRAAANATWLVVFHIQENWASSVRIPAPSRLFARCSKDYVVYGTHTGEGDDGFRRWILRCYSVRERRLVGKSVGLDRVIGSDIGANVYFDIIDGYFYALSNQNGHELVVGMADSYYYCCRMPLDDMDALQEATAASLWRRYNAEGTIDDRWTFIRMHKHEQTGHLLIVEARKEWRYGSSASRRTYYTQEVAFPADEDGALCETRGGQTAGGSIAAYTSARGTSGEGSHDADLTQTDAAGQQGQGHRPYRTPACVHPGDDSSKMMPFTPSTCLVRTYNPGCETFVDLVNLPSTSSPSCRRLCLRAGARRLRAPCPMLPEADEADEADKADEGNADGDDAAAEQRLYPLAQIEQQYQTIEPTTWPRAVDSQQDDDDDDDDDDSRNEALYQILNPPGHEGDVLGTWDDRSLLYSVGVRDGEEKTSALVFVTFDASTCLSHVELWPTRRPGRAAAPVALADGQSDWQGGQGSSLISPGFPLAHQPENFTSQEEEEEEEELTLDLDRQSAWLAISHRPMCQYISRGFGFGISPLPDSLTLT